MVTIFLVEDDEAIRNIYHIWLTIRGYKIVGTASNGAEAVERYKSLSIRPDVVIMDYWMPLKNGIEATKEILQVDETAKIIFASANEKVREEALSAGAISFNLKPFDIDLLLNEIQKVISMTRTP